MTTQVKQKLDLPQTGPEPQPSTQATAINAAFGLLPGEFAIRTYLTNNYLTARDGGRHSIDAVITAATTLGPNEKFKLTTFQPDFTIIQTLQGYYVSAVGAGGLGGNFPASQVLQTERTSLADDALFSVGRPGRRWWFQHSDLQWPLPHGTGRRRQDSERLSHRCNGCQYLGDVLDA